MPPPPGDPPSLDDQARFEIIMKHGHQDLVQAVAFNAYGDRCATGSVDGKIRVFNRHRDGLWRLCDSWGAHSGEILELQWLPPTIYPNLLASIGIEGRFKLWIEDPAAAPGRRFSQRAKGNAKAAFETRSPRSPYRSFSMKHDDETRHTYLALLAADGILTVLENEVPEDLAEYSTVDELRVCPKPARGEEASFRVRFDPNPEPCYAALRAGVRRDALGLVVAAMDSVRIYRTRPVTTTSYGLEGVARALYLVAEVRGHRGLVRDVAWAPANFRGYDIIATACQDGYVRVVRLDTPLPPADPMAKSWAVHDVLAASNAPPTTTTGGDVRKKREKSLAGSSISSIGGIGAGIGAATAGGGSAASALSTTASVASSLSSMTLADAAVDAIADDASVLGIGNTSAVASAAASDAHANSSSVGSSAATSFSGLPSGMADASASSASAAIAAANAAAADRRATGEPGQVRHTVRELARLENHRTPVWRVAFDDDGQILGSVGDDGKLLCYRQMPDGTWARSCELTVMKMRMMAP